MEKPDRKAMAIFSATVLAALLLLIFSPTLSAGDDDKEPKISRPGAGLAFPKLIWSRAFPDDLVGVAVAKQTGDVAALTKNKLYYFKGDSPDPAWTAGDGWKHAQDLGLSWDGRMVLAQSDTSPKKTTEGLNLTMNLYDGSGRVIWQKPNPYRYQNAMLSPSGKYILMGEVMHHGVKCFDDNLNQLWVRDIQFWSITFDPLEHYVFDAEVGLLYTAGGEQVWNMGAYARILSVSDDADLVMTQYFRTKESGQRLFLIGRTQARKIELAGAGGCVSPDGLFCAFVNAERKLVVFRSRELMEAGGQGIPPLFETSFTKPWAMQISRDNLSLFAMGEVSQLKSVMTLVDLDKMKTAWEKPVEDSLRVALPTEDNRYVLVKPNERAVIKYRCY